MKPSIGEQILKKVSIHFSIENTFLTKYSNQFILEPSSNEQTVRKVSVHFSIENTF